MYRPRLKHFKERKRNDFFPELVVGTLNITLKSSHGLMITPNIKKKTVPTQCCEYAFFVKMAMTRGDC
jgi:hypothetical protein